MDDVEQKWRFLGRRSRSYWMLALVLFVGFLLIRKVSRSILFPTEYVYSTATVPDLDGLETFFIENDGAKVDVFFLKSDSEKAKSGVVFYAHGNAESIDDSMYRMRKYTKLGYHVVLIEYRGYGRSTGSPSEENIRADYVSAYKKIIQREDVDTSKIIYHGRSLGGGVICALANLRPPNVLILESTFTSVEAMADTLFPFASKLVVDPFRSLEVVAKLDIPVLVMHGTRDEIIPFSQGKTLVGAAKEGTFIQYLAGHNDFPPDSKVYWKDIEGFLNTAFK